MEAWVSTKRVNAFLWLQELDYSDYYGKGVEHTSLASLESQETSGDVQHELKIEDEAEGEVESVKGEVESVKAALGEQDGGISLLQGSPPYAIAVRDGCFAWSRAGREGKVGKRKEEESKVGELEDQDEGAKETINVAVQDIQTGWQIHTYVHMYIQISMYSCSCVYCGN